VITSILFIVTAVVACLVLVPPLGLVGAAMAYASAIVVQLLSIATTLAIILRRRGERMRELG
jgi:O-antigen/teichoic acid export membrane protein